MSEYRQWEERKAATPHKCWSCQRIIPRAEQYRVETIFTEGEKPERLKECRQCTWLYETCPTDFTNNEDTHNPALEWDHDIPTGWEPHITAWQNKWRGPDGDPFNIHIPPHEFAPSTEPMTLAELLHHLEITHANYELNN